jgi:DNA-binding NtrC family response regulator
VIEHPKSSPEPASAKEPIVFVIDDDASMRRALTNLFQSVGLAVQVFGSAPAACAIMLASVRTLSVPLTADAAGDAAAGEKIFAHSQREDQLTMETKLEQIAVKAVNQLPKSVVREIRTPRSVGAGGGRPPPATR